MTKSYQWGHFAPNNYQLYFVRKHWYLGITPNTSLGSIIWTLHPSADFPTWWVVADTWWINTSIDDCTVSGTLSVCFYFLNFDFNGYMRWGMVYGKFDKQNASTTYAEPRTPFQIRDFNYGYFSSVLTLRCRDQSLLWIISDFESHKNPRVCFVNIAVNY